MNVFFPQKEFEIGYVLIQYLKVLKYRLTDITKPTKLYLLYITVYMHIVFHPAKRVF